MFKLDRRAWFHVFASRLYRIELLNIDAQTTEKNIVPCVESPSIDSQICCRFHYHHEKMFYALRLLNYQNPNDKMVIYFLIIWKTISKKTLKM